MSSEFCSLNVQGKELALNKHKQQQNKSVRRREGIWRIYGEGTDGLEVLRYTEERSQLQVMKEARVKGG